MKPLFHTHNKRPQRTKPERSINHLQSIKIMPNEVRPYSPDSFPLMFSRVCLSKLLNSIKLAFGFVLFVWNTIWNAIFNEIGEQFHSIMRGYIPIAHLRDEEKNLKRLACFTVILPVGFELFGHSVFLAHLDFDVQDPVLKLGGAVGNEVLA